jgi:hypothetical protein
MPPQHDEAEVQRRGQDQADRPHSHVQRIAAMTTAAGDSPVAVVEVHDHDHAVECRVPGVGSSRMLHSSYSHPHLQAL